LTFASPEEPDECGLARFPAGRPALHLIGFDIMYTILTSPARLRRALSIGIWLRYLMALFTPVVNDRGGAANYHVGYQLGLTALILGWLPPSTLPWSANLLLYAMWRFGAKPAGIGL
jgi:hypothetical protein